MLEVERHKVEHQIVNIYQAHLSTIILGEARSRTEFISKTSKPCGGVLAVFFEFIT